MLAAHTAHPTARCRSSHSRPNLPVAVALHRCSATAQGRSDLLPPSRQFLLPVRRRRHLAASAAASILQIGRLALFPAPRDDYGTAEEAAKPAADQQRREPWVCAAARRVLLCKTGRYGRGVWSRDRRCCRRSWALSGAGRGDGVGIAG